MSIDWCIGIREACEHWRDAPMLQQTFEALERTLGQENDACIDCAKATVEIICRVIIESFHSPTRPLLPIQNNPSLSDWLSAAVRALKLGDIRDEKFKKLVSSHHKLADALNELRDKAGPASHGKDPYLERLAVHHRRTAVLSADAIVAFLHKAYLDSQRDPSVSKEPWERFADQNAIIDAQIGIRLDFDEEDNPSLVFILPGESGKPNNDDDLPIRIQKSKLLYLLDRSAYVEALRACRPTAAGIEPDAQGTI